MDTGRVRIRPEPGRRTDFHGRGPAVHGKSAPEQGMREDATAARGFGLRRLYDLP